MNTFIAPLARRAAFVVAAFVAVGLAVLPAGPARAADDVTWTVRTASNAFGSDRTGYTYAVEPGATVDDALVVANHGDDPLELAVYAADGYTTDSGQFDLVVGGAPSVAIGAWVRSASGTITVGPGKTVEVPFRLTVPSDATPGDYAGGIVTSLAQPQTENGISVDRRLGLRIALRVDGVLSPGLAVEDMHVSWDGGLNPVAGGDATISYTLHNTGNAVLSADQSATIAGPFGMLPAAVGAVEAPPQLLPGEKWRVTVPVKDVAASVLLTATASVTPMMTDVSGSTSALPVVEASSTGWAVPWTLLVVIVLVAAAVVFALLLRRRRRARRQEQEDARVREAVERALAEAGAPR